MLFSPDDTIIAISTPIGRAALGVIRLSGPKALEITAQLFEHAGKKKFNSASSHTIMHGWLKDSAMTIDEVMAVVMRRPNSYTGEDVVEISAHGGPVLLNTIVKLFLDKGIRLAGPGEFTFRAFLNGKLDLSRAEAVADLISSKTKLAAQSAVNQLRGTLFKRIHDWRTKLIELLASLEVSLDYGEEDISFLSNEEIISALNDLLENIKLLMKTADKGKYLRDGIKVAIIGKPNAGKSSLLNVLLEMERSIVTEIPGTTRDIIEESLECRGVPLVIMDTAGLRQHTFDPVEKIGQERTINSIKNSDIILWVMDASEPISDDDRHIAALISEDKKVIFVWNKIDINVNLTENEVNSLVPFHFPFVKISALKNKGISELEDTILSQINLSDNISSDAPLINIRHNEILKNSANAVIEAINSVQKTKNEEIVAFHLREALNFLGEITGETATEEILDNIFSRFCVGK